MNLSEIVQSAGSADKLCQQTGCARRATVAIVVSETLRYYYCDQHDTAAGSELIEGDGLTTIRTMEAYEAAQTVLCRLVELDAELRQLGELADPDARLREAVADLLHGMHRVSATLGVDAAIFEGVEL